MEEINDQEELSLSDQIKAFIEGRKLERLEKFDKETEKGLKALKAEENAAFEMVRFEKRQQELDSFKPKNWLSDAAKKAKQLQLVTHAVKFTHSDAKGTSLFAEPKSQNHFVSTTSLEKKTIDVGGNAAALPIGKLLLLEENGKALVHLVMQDDGSPLAPFAESEEQLATWIEGFKAAVIAKDPSSHKLAKQLYWPLEDGEYHLLLPLFATSLAHELYERVQTARFSEEQVTARDARRNKKSSHVSTVEFPNLAVQSFGGTKPQNISQLNSSRNGRAYLLSSAPPVWRSQTKPPLNVSSVFNGPFNRLVHRQAYELREFLAAKLEQRSTMAIRQKRARLIDDIVDRLISYAEQVRQFDTGWTLSSECKLPLHQQLWLDPRRKEKDAEFNEAFEGKDWQAKVAEDFSRFLNAELEKNKKIATGDPEFIQWKVLTAQELRLMKDDIKGVYHDG